MQWVTSIFQPRRKTLVDKISEILPAGENNALTTGMTTYIMANPMVVVKSVPIVIIGFYSFPIILTGWAYLPWIWVSYELWTKTNLIAVTYNILSKSIQYVTSS